MIDITMTAILRPELHKEVFEFLKENLITKEKLRLIINIDPLGEEISSPEEVLENTYNYFNEVKYNISKEPHFFKALRGVWSNSETKFTLQGEDDGILKKKLYLDDIIEICENEEIDIFNFFCKRKTKGNRPLHSRQVNGRTYKFINLSGLVFPSFTPSLLKKRYLKDISIVMGDAKKAASRPIKFFHKSIVAREVCKDMKTVKLIDKNFSENANKDLLEDIGKKGKKKHEIGLKREEK